MISPSSLPFQYTTATAFHHENNISGCSEALQIKCHYTKFLRLPLYQDERPGCHITSQ